MYLLYKYKSRKSIKIEKILDLGLGELVSSVHSRDFFNIKTTLTFNPMLEVLDFGSGEIVSSVHGRKFI